MPQINNLPGTRMFHLRMTGCLVHKAVFATFHSGSVLSNYNEFKKYNLKNIITHNMYVFIIE